MCYSVINLHDSVYVYMGSSYIVHNGGAKLHFRARGHLRQTNVATSIPLHQ